jgi:DNA-binding MarR family transcriptional regulator
MNLFDTITLQAFSLARLRVNGELPTDLQQTVHRLGEAIARHQPNIATEVHQFVEQHNCLREPYEAVYQNLQKQYQQQYQQQEQVKNVYLTSGFMERLPNAWEKIVVQILTADDPKAIAEQLMKHLKGRSPILQPTDIPSAFLSLLQQELAMLDEQETAVLRVIEQQLLTVEDLAHIVGLPVERVQAILQHLWQEGLIDFRKRSLMDKLLSVVAQSSRNCPINYDTSFNLTAKGHYHLHPIIKPRRREGTIG